jgi:hypothetical protein
MREREVISSNLTIHKTCKFYSKFKIIVSEREVTSSNLTIHKTCKFDSKFKIIVKNDRRWV